MAEEPPLPAVRRPSRRRRLLRGGLLGVAVLLAVVALRDQWGRVASQAQELSAPLVGLALLLALASLAASALAFRASLGALGSPLPVPVAARIYLVGQLGKYLPGSVWPVLAQMEMAAEVGVPRWRGGVAALLSMGVGVVTAAPLALLAAPVLLEAVAAPPAVEGLALAALVASVVLLHPRVLDALVRTLLRVARRPLPDERLETGAVARVALATATAMTLAGLGVAALAYDLGAVGWQVVPLAVGGFAAASVAGLLVVPLPAGAGVRELVLVLALLALLPPAGAAVVAVASRLTLTAADLVAGVTISWAVRRILPNR